MAASTACTFASAAGTLLALTAGMMGTVVEVLLIALFAFTLLSAAVAVARRITHELHG